eukprot:547763_1
MIYGNSIDNKIAFKNEITNNDLFNICKNDYRFIEFRFISSNPFYHSLHQRIMRENPRLMFKDVLFLSDAFTMFENAIKCHHMSLSLNASIKITDSIFVYWMYIYAMSLFVSEYIEQPDSIYAPLQ